MSGRNSSWFGMIRWETVMTLPFLCPAKNPSFFPLSINFSMTWFGTLYWTTILVKSLQLSDGWARFRPQWNLSTMEEFFHNGRIFPQWKNLTTMEEFDHFGSKTVLNNNNSCHFTSFVLFGHKSKHKSWIFTLDQVISRHSATLAENYIYGNSYIHVISCHSATLAEKLLW